MHLHMSTGHTILQVEALLRHENGLPVVQDVSFEMATHERLAIMGETGSGKSSVLRMIGGLLQPDAGKVYFEGKRVAGPQEVLIPGHPGIAYLSQYSDLRPNFFVHEVIEYVNDLPAQEAAQLYALCEITHLLQRKTTQLSGGEKQRVALARLLGTRPRLLLLDEPFSHLDYAHKQTIKQVIANAMDTLQLSVLLVSHDAQDVLPWATRMLVMRQGKIVARGTPTQLYLHPPTAYTAALLGPYLTVDAATASLLTGNTQLAAQPHAKYMVRPGAIEVTRIRTGLMARVLRIAHTGHGYSCTLQLPMQQLTLQLPLHTMHSLRQGDEVGLQARSQLVSRLADTIA